MQFHLSKAGAKVLLISDTAKFIFKKMLLKDILV